MGKQKPELVSFVLTFFVVFLFRCKVGNSVTNSVFMKEMLYEVRCLKSNEDMILALAAQFKQLSHEPEKFR